MPSYRYTVEGTGARGATWRTTGSLDVPQLGNFPEIPMMALRESFETLTQGKAEYGKPGEGGCQGPYVITKLVVEAEPVN